VGDRCRSHDHLVRCDVEIGGMADSSVMRDLLEWQRTAREILVDMANKIERLTEENEELRKQIEIYRRPTNGAANSHK